MESQDKTGAYLPVYNNLLSSLSQLMGWIVIEALLFCSNHSAAQSCMACLISTVESIQKFDFKLRIRIYA